MKIRIALSKDLYQKYASLDLLATDNAAFYDNYTRALKEADQRPVQVLYSFQYFLSNFCSAAGVLSVVATMDPVLILFSIVPVITSSLINMKLSKERYHYEMLLTKDTRKTDYIKRVFTVPEYREEIRTNAYLPFFLKKYSAYFLEDGAIVEHGSHEELMRQNGKYAALYQIQAKQYSE